jgi:hypothetical protein
VFQAPDFQESHGGGFPVPRCSTTIVFPPLTQPPVHGLDFVRALHRSGCPRSLPPAVDLGSNGVASRYLTFHSHRWVRPPRARTAAFTRPQGGRREPSGVRKHPNVNRLSATPLLLFPPRRPLRLRAKLQFPESPHATPPSPQRPCNTTDHHLQPTSLSSVASFAPLRETLPSASAASPCETPISRKSSRNAAKPATSLQHNRPPPTTHLPFLRRELRAVA